MPTPSELASEIEDDPQGLDYKEANGDWKADDVIADLLNDPSVYSATVWRTSVPMSDIFGAIDWSDLAGVSTGEKLMFMTITQTDVLDADSPNIRDAFADIFPSGSTSLSNLQSLVQKQGSRAEELWGDGTEITAGDVGRAANA